jgi:hypothetical protein
MHNKMIFVQQGHSKQNDSRAWVYVGSANLSESAFVSGVSTDLSPTWLDQKFEAPN